MSTTEVKQTQKVQISIADVKRMLNEGKDRNAIAQHYGLNFTNKIALFKHPELKGLKVKRAFNPAFEVVEDIPTIPAQPVPVEEEKEVVKDEEVASSVSETPGAW